MFVERIFGESGFDEIGASAEARAIARKKANRFIFKIHALNRAAALILKQEAVSVGGEFLLPKKAILCEDSAYDGVLILNENQMERIISKCKIQPFNLKKVAESLESHLQKPRDSRDSRQIMGIINITDDSFYAKSRVKNIDDILAKIEDMIARGVEIIDIGGASSRPDSSRVESSVELARIRDAILAIESAGLPSRAIFSIDTYNFEVAQFCIEHGFHIINDIEGISDFKLAHLAHESRAKIVLMHNSWLFPHGENIIQSVDEFFAVKLESLLNLGIPRENIILDIGFGFGKNCAENLALTRNLAHFLRFNCALLVGASMKRAIGEITAQETDLRGFGTLAMHQIALDLGANIIRCHDYAAHVDMLKIWRAVFENG